MYDRAFHETAYAEYLHKARNGSRKQYYYNRALKSKEGYKSMYPEEAEAIQKRWDDFWHKRFLKAVA